MARVSKKEGLRRERISRSLKKWHQTHVHAWERRLGRKMVKEHKKETRKVKARGRTIKERILSLADDARKASGMPAIVDSTTHADGSFEAEIRIDIPRKERPMHALASVAEQLAFPKNKNLWVSSGWAFQPNAGMTDEERAAYERFAKWLQVHAHYQRPEKFVTNILGSRRIAALLQGKGRRKPEQAFIRIFWDPSGERPK